MFKINYPTNNKARANDIVLTMLEGGFKNGI